MAAEKETREKEFVYSIGTHYYMDYLDQNEKETLKGERQTEKAKKELRIITFSNHTRKGLG